jgi:hypothetical protein
MNPSPAGDGENSAADSQCKTGTSESAQAQTKVLQKKYKLEFPVEPERMKKVEEAKLILSKKCPNGVPLGKLLEEALDVYLEKHSPERKIKRREKRKIKAEAHKNGLLDGSSKAKKLKNEETMAVSKTKEANPNHDKRFRHIQPAVQDKVFARDGRRESMAGNS